MSTPEGVIDYNVQTTTLSSEGNDLSPQMKSYYDKNVIRSATDSLVHDQFAQKRRIPRHNGKTVTFRKISPLKKATTPLTEGVTPTGNELNYTTVTAELKQYGDYITLSDVLSFTAVDNNLVEAGAVLGNQAGETLDAITREAICSGLNVQYAGGVYARHLLKGGENSDNNYISVDDIKKAARKLRRNKAKKIRGSYVAIIHPDSLYDLTNDPAWESVKSYADPKDMYNGEVGRLFGIRFVETTEAKIFTAKDLSASSRNLTVSSVLGNTITIKEELGAGDAKALAGRKIIIGSSIFTVTSAAAGVEGAATITVSETVSGISADAIIYPGEAGAKGRSVYATLIFGADAYGVTELEGGGLTNVIKQLGSGGSSDPLNQRATTGWKALRAAQILVDEYLVRLESASSFDEN